jgi:hypothetical protein
MNLLASFSSTAAAKPGMGQGERQIASVRAKPEMRKNGAFCASPSASP